MSVFSALQDWLLANAGAWWTYLVTAGLCYVDGFFPPLPSESVVIAMASMGFHGQRGVNLWLLVPVVCAAAWLGDQTAYLIGRWVPLEKLFRGEKGQGILTKAHDLIHHKGPQVLLTARFIPIYRVAMNMTAGGVDYPWHKYAIIDAVSVGLWASFSLAIGAASGALFKGNPLLGVVVGVLLGFVVGWLIDVVGKARERRRAQA